MKLDSLLFAFIFFIPGYSEAQASRSLTEPLTFEWKTEFSVGETGVSGLVVHEQNIYLTQTGGASVFNMLNHRGALTYTARVNNTRIRTLFVNDAHLFSMGDQHLTKRDFAGSVIKEHMLPWVDGEYISTTNGAILRDRAYTFAFGDLLKFPLNGEQLLKKKVAKLCNSQNLKVGGSYIYLYGQISDPPLGPRLMQYDTLGNQRWDVDPGRFVYGMYTDTEDFCYMLTAEYGGVGYVQKYNAEGRLVYNVKLPGQCGKNAFRLGDSLFVCGQVSSTERINGQKMAAFCILSAKTGEVYYQQTHDLDPEPTHNEDFTHIISEGSNIYVAGVYGGQGKTCVLVKYSKGGITGLKDEKAPRTGFNIFPNPGGSKFTITCENNKTKTLKVTVRNLAGQVVFNRDISCNADGGYTLYLGKHPAGNYTVEIAIGNDVSVKKIVVE